MNPPQAHQFGSHSTLPARCFAGRGAKRLRGIWAAFGLAILLSFPGCKPQALQTLLEPSEALASVLADEAARIAGTKKQVALITPDASWGPPSLVEQELKAALKKHGMTVLTVKAANLGNPMTSREIGLKAPDFFEALEKSANAGAVISLAGAPLLKGGDAARLNPDHPPVLVVATATLGDKRGVHGEPLEMARLLEAKVIQLAIVDGAGPAQSGAKADPAREIFAQNYHILRHPD